MTKRLQVLVVEDSALFREAIASTLAHDSDFAPVRGAATGEEALAIMAEQRPDVVTIDLGLPDMDGFELVQRVMRRLPLPILVLTASLSPGWRRAAVDALAMGALDVMEKPTGSELANLRWREQFCERLKVIARAPVVPHISSEGKTSRAKRVTQIVPAAAPPPEPRAPTTVGASIDLFVLVGSAGAVRALRVILELLEPHLPLKIPVLIALHLGPMAGETLARHLADDLGTPAQVVEEAQSFRPGVLYVAPGARHLSTQDRRAHIVDDLAGSQYRPNLDHLLSSVARDYGTRVVVAMLSGMGVDGCNGLLEVRRAGGITFSQDAGSCLVSSMPIGALAVGAVATRSSLAEIAEAMLQCQPR